MKRLMSYAATLVVLAISGCASSGQTMRADRPGVAVSGPYVGGGGGYGLH